MLIDSQFRFTFFIAFTQSQKRPSLIIYIIITTAFWKTTMCFCTNNWIYRNGMVWSRM